MHFIVNMTKLKSKHMADMFGKPDFRDL